MRVLWSAVTAGLVAFVLDLALGWVGPWLTRVPKGFPPFTVLPILSGTMGGAMLAGAAFAVVRAVSRTPERTFLLVALGAFAVSLGLPLRLSFTRSARFAGVTPAAQMLLVVMHAVVATASVTALTGRE